MKHFVAAVLAVLCLATGVSAGLPTDPNTRDAWYRGEFEGVRVHYSYSTSNTYRSGVSEVHCRADYTYEGRIRLLVVEALSERRGSPASITTFYDLKPTSVHQHKGFELVRTSYQLGRGPDLVVQPTISGYDPFSEFCACYLARLLVSIPAPEAKMFRDQYGVLFGIK